MLPGVRRRTGHGIPRYDGSDVFVLTTGEQLVDDRGRRIPDGGRGLPAHPAGGRRLGDHRAATAPATSWERPTRVAWSIRPIRCASSSGSSRGARTPTTMSWSTAGATTTCILGPPRGGRAARVYPHEVRWCHASDGRPLCVARFVYDYTGPDDERPDAATSLLSGFPMRMSWRCRAVVGALRRPRQRGRRRPRARCGPLGRAGRRARLRGHRARSSTPTAALCSNAGAAAPRASRPLGTGRCRSICPIALLGAHGGAPRRRGWPL